MNRAQFFKNFKNPTATTLLDTYNSPLTLPEVLHLLRRTTMAPDWKTAQSLVGKTASTIVDLLLQNALKNPKPSPPTWVNDTVKFPWRLPAAEQQKASDAVYKKLYEENLDLKNWWANAMNADKLSMREKMTLFWHGHFTTKYAIDEIMMAQAMYRQNDIFRTHALGNFRTIAEKISLDSAMLMFLDGNGSTKVKPNENYSRELLELYTTGIGYYTEKDVQEGARVFTGWKANMFSDDNPAINTYTPYFKANDHDTGSKIYLGLTIPATEKNDETSVKTNEVHKLIDIILTQRADATAIFLAEKLYKFFVYSNPTAINKEIVADMAKILKENKFEVAPVLKALFTSKYFFDKKFIGAQIKAPAETIVNFTGHFDIKADWKHWVMSTMGQELLNPPNVAGWPGYRNWVDTRTFPFGVQQMGYFVWNQTDEYMVTWTKQFSDANDVKLLTKDVLSLFLAKTPTATLIDKFQNILLSGAPDYEWPEILKKPNVAGLRLKLMIIDMIKNPNFHLS